MREGRPRSPSPSEPVPELRRIRIRDNGEPLVDFLEQCPALYWVPRHPVFDYRRFTLARETVARMLGEAAARLPGGVRLAVVEGWRPPAIQRQMHAATRQRLAREHPEWSPAYLTRVTNRFSAPMDRRVPPPHTTGGAVDVHLADAAGRPLDFTSPYGILDAAGAPASAPGLSDEARRNRALLAKVMSAAGFTNYPAEWWHWSYGDPGWAYRAGHPEAIYGAIEPERTQGKPGAEPEFRVWENPGWEE